MKANDYRALGQEAWLEQATSALGTGVTIPADQNVEVVAQAGLCSVTVLFAGQQYSIPTDTELKLLSDLL